MFRSVNAICGLVEIERHIVFGNNKADAITFFFGSRWDNTSQCIAQHENKTHQVWGATAVYGAFNFHWRAFHTDLELPAWYGGQSLGVVFVPGFNEQIAVFHILDHGSTVHRNHHALCIDHDVGAGQKKHAFIGPVGITVDRVHVHDERFFNALIVMYDAIVQQ